MNVEQTFKYQGKATKKTTDPKEVDSFDDSVATKTNELNS